MKPNVIELVRQIEALEDYEESSEALLQLSRLSPTTASSLALRILTEQAGDVHLQAFAFYMLYRTSRDVAFQYIAENSLTCDQAILAEMVGEVTTDVGLLPESVDLAEVVQLLRSTVAVRRTEGRAIRESSERFEQAYPLSAD